MSLSDEQLAAIEAHLAAEKRECLRYHTSSSNYAVEVSLADAQDLCAEVRRLRAAIRDVLPRLRGGSDTDVFCHLCDDFYRGPDGAEPHAPECPVVVLEAALGAGADRGAE